MIFQLMGLYLSVEGLGSIIHFWNSEDHHNKIFQLGRLARVVFGLLWVWLG